ncbi:MAG: hypothetical protein GX224_02275 [Thermoplasmatales archaeon]|nr:hypothetical protein [Thermoplasmatales archaeon]
MARYPGLGDALVSAVRAGCEGTDVAVAFSGGLDSGLVAAIAKGHAKSVTLYTCGGDASYDVAKARELSGTLGLPWVHVPLTKEGIGADIKAMVAATGVSDPFTISYELPLFRVCGACGEGVVLSGQGADEHFMGCAKYVGAPDGEYEALARAGVERLTNISLPCERRIAEHFGKEIVYPYLDAAVLSEIGKLDPSELRPADMGSRKSVLKAVATDLGFPFLTAMEKKSSQYGSGAAGLIRALAKGEGKMFNEYVMALHDEAVCGSAGGTQIVARVDPLVKARAEGILREQGITPSEAIGMFYRAIVDDGGLGTRRD